MRFLLAMMLATAPALAQTTTFGTSNSLKVTVLPETTGGWGKALDIKGKSEFFRFGYGATGPLVKMQSAGTDDAGSAQPVLDVTQQIDLATGGAQGATAAIKAGVQVNGQPSSNYWGVGATAYIQNLADLAPPPGGSQHGAIYAHVVKTTAKVPDGTDSAVLASAWGGCDWWVLSDRTGLPSSKGGALVGLELDIDGNGADDHKGPDNNADKWRFARQVVLRTHQKDATKPFEVGFGDYWNATHGGVEDSFFNVISAYYAGYTIAAIDLSQGVGQRSNPYIDHLNRAVAIKMRDGLKLSFNGDGMTGSYLTHYNGMLEYWAGGQKAFVLGDSGSFYMLRRAPSAINPGVYYGKLELVCGSTPGTARLIAYAGTSNTPTTIADGIGGGVGGC